MRALSRLSTFRRVVSSTQHLGPALPRCSVPLFRSASALSLSWPDGPSSHGRYSAELQEQVLRPLEHALQRFRSPLGVEHGPQKTSTSRPELAPARLSTFGPFQQRSSGTQHGNHAQIWHFRYGWKSYPWRVAAGVDQYSCPANNHAQLFPFSR